ncbi:MAG: hypothetical protein OEY33_03000 [Bdellovibrionales bacterium]|jgi:hypothetical protein|nr:hypothetical protein [Bdellovibrionales bacterium]
MWRTICFIFAFFPVSTFALMTELGGSIGYDREIYGTSRENTIRTRTYTGSVAFYFLKYTAIELNYSNSTKMIEEHTIYSINDAANNVSVVGNNSTLKTEIFGIGIRQALSSKEALIRPLVSLGYAKQFVESSGDTIYRLDLTGEEIRVFIPKEKRRFDSIFGTFRLQVRLTAALRFTASVSTYFKADDFNRAQDNLKYLLGFSWIF